MTTVAALCSGYGGLELGLQLAGVDVDLRWYAEIDRHASQVMAHHHPHVPNLGDLTEITDPPAVDVVAAGFPCQPVSHAGKRKGVNDARWLIDDVCQVARRADARWLLLENVSGIFTANRGEAFYRVLAALAENGFAAEWTSVRASDVGAPHQRLRWFLLAYADESGREARVDTGHDGERSRSQPVGSAAPAADTDGDGHGPRSHTRRMGRLDGEDAGGAQERERARSVVGDRGDAAAANTGSFGTGLHGSDGGQGREPGGARRAALLRPGNGAIGSDRADTGAAAAADTDLSGRSERGRRIADATQLAAAQCAGQDSARWGEYADAIARWEPVVGRPAPEPTDGQRRLNPRFVEWMMGLEDGWVCDAVDGRSHQLRILGNGVVPQQAAYAIRLLNEVES